MTLKDLQKHKSVRQILLAKQLKHLIKSILIFIAIKLDF